MTRTILILIAVGAFLGVIAGPGCAAGGVGDPCTPEQEYDVCFAGFDEQEVNVESKSFQCQTRLCLVNHFQGRVSCPYGQSAGETKIPSGQCADLLGGSPVALYAGQPTCSIPGGSAVLGDGAATGSLGSAFQVQVAVQPQVTPRQASNTVYCSCRCANVNGATDDGPVYCACPDGYTCTQLVTSIGTTEQELTGGYCIKTGTAFNPEATSGQTNCQPGSNPCQLPE